MKSLDNWTIMTKVPAPICPLNISIAPTKNGMIKLKMSATVIMMVETAP